MVYKSLVFPGDGVMTIPYGKTTHGLTLAQHLPSDWGEFHEATSHSPTWTQSQGEFPGRSLLARVHGGITWTTWSRVSRW